MIREGSASEAHAAPHRAALATTAHNAVANYANGAGAQVVPVNVDTHNVNPFAVGWTLDWWRPFVHLRSLTPLSTGTSVTWAI